MVTGLEPGTEYSFWLMAWNVYGESEYSKQEVVAHTLGNVLLQKAIVKNFYIEVNLCIILPMYEQLKTNNLKCFGEKIQILGFLFVYFTPKVS